MANEVVKKFSDQLSDKLISVEKALPKDFNQERFVQNCLAVMNEIPQLAKINPAMTIQGLLKGAYLGLDFLNRECYLIPYGNSVQFQTDYKGEIKFTKKYSIRKIKDIYAKVVRDGDEFVEEIIDGKPSTSSRSPSITGRLSERSQLFFISTAVWLTKQCQKTTSTECVTTIQRRVSQKPGRTLTMKCARRQY